MGKALLNNFSLFFFEELCRNCRKVVEVEFSQIDHCNSRNYYATNFNTERISKFKCLCFDCSQLIEKSPSSIAGVEHINVLDIQIPIVYVGRYSKIIQKLVRKIKYDDDRLIGNDLGQMLSMLVLENKKPWQNIPNLDRSNSILIPVPLHRKRLKERGYNQAEIIAKRFNKDFKSCLDTTILKRLQNTKPQFDLGIEARKKNVVNAFACTKTLDSSKTYILIDDVFTTGTTLRECAQELIKAEARQILALAIARA